MLTELLQQKEIQGFFSRAAMEKALAYRAQGRVTGLKVSDDFRHVSSRVKGAEAKPYIVDIVLKFDSDRLVAVDSDCTCAVASNCKHVAATLLEAIGKADKLSTATPSSEPSSAAAEALLPPAPVLPPDIVGWLDSIGTSARGDKFPEEMTQRLLYHLNPVRDVAQARVTVSLVTAHLDKGGSPGEIVSRPSFENFEPARAPRYYRDSDIDLLRELSRLQGQSAAPQAFPAELLKRIVATKRAYWLTHQRGRLRWGEPREGRIEWRSAGDNGVAPRLVVSGAISLNAEPPVYIDEPTRTIGLVQLKLHPRLAYEFLSAPVIPRAQVPEVSRRLALGRSGLDEGLLPGRPAEAMEIDEDPVPIMRLKLGRGASRSTQKTSSPMAVAYLGFRYGPIVIDRAERATRVEVFQYGRVHAVIRRRARERDALQRLADIGFVENTSVYSSLDAGRQRDLTLARPEDWFDFVGRKARALRAEGFDIRIEDDFPYRLAASSNVFDAEFENSGADWFDLSLGIEIDGVRHDLAPMLAALVSNPDFKPQQAKKLAEAGDQLYLPMGDGLHLALAADRFLPLLLALHSLTLSGASLTPAGKIRLPRTDVVPLLALENENLKFKGADKFRRLASLLAGRGMNCPELPKGFNATLRAYQQQGVAWLDLLREAGLGGVLADDMGLGKTVQVLALLALEKARGHLATPALIVAPTSLMTNWVNEARKFAPDLRVLVLHGSDRKASFAAIPDHDVVLTTYPLIARDHDMLLARQWHIAVLDEAQTIKNPDAATSRLIRNLKATHRFCLTGTPMENHLGELWSIMGFANPGYLGDKTAFAKQWRTPIEKHGDGARAMSLAQRVRPFMLRRTKSEVATELPSKTEIVETIVLEDSQRDLYDSIRLSMSARVREAIAERGLGKSHILVLEALLRLRQACCDPALLKLDDGKDRGSAKLERLMEMVEELTSEGRKIIVFSQFTTMLDLIRKRLDAASIRYSLLTGQTKDRGSAVEAFQGGATDVFLISLKAGGVGLNLTAADTVVIFDPWWNPAVEQQAIDRAHRIGQDKPVFVYRLVAQGTVEEKMDELKARKRALADSLFDQDGKIGAALTEEDVRALFEG